MSKIIVVIGPTGSGKTLLSIHLAKKYNAVVINADAYQMYKGVNIGTAKITKEEMETIPHYLIDFLSLTSNYSIKDYQTDGRIILNDLIKQNKNIIIVGGSGLYIKSLLYDYKFNNNSSKIDLSMYSNKELKDKVDSIYKDNKIHINNRVRLERFISNYLTTNEIIKTTKSKDTPLYNFTLIYLLPDRQELYNHIEKRTHSMIDKGLINEVSSLKEYPKLKTIIGYKEILSYLDNTLSLEESINLIIKNTRNYAKRQITFFNNQFTNLNTFKVDYTNFNNTIKEVDNYLEKESNI